LSDARESTNRVKKDVIKEFFSKIVVFLVKKGSYTTFNTAKIRKIWKKKWKIRKTWSMTKKSHKGPSIKDVRRDGGGGVWSNADTCGQGGGG